MMLHTPIICWLPRNLLTVPTRTKKYYPGWRRLYSLDDYFNLSQQKPDTYQQWSAEWRQVGDAALAPWVLKAFDISRLPHHLKNRGRLSVVSSTRSGKSLLAHEKRLGYQRRLFGEYGLGSGVNPSHLLDSFAQLASEQELKKYLEPDVEVFKRDQQTRKLEKSTKIEEIMHRITENLRQLPELLAKHDAMQAKKQEMKFIQSERKKQLLEEARDRFGYYVDTRDPKFVRLAEEKSEEAKLLKKASRKK